MAYKSHLRLQPLVSLLFSLVSGCGFLCWLQRRGLKQTFVFCALFSVYQSYFHNVGIQYLLKATATSLSVGNTVLQGIINFSWRNFVS